MTAKELLSGQQKGQSILAYKAYDADWIRRQIEDQGATPNIPSKANRKWKACFSAALYKERNLVERFFNKLKFFRRIATRYDKLGSTFMAMVKLASIRIRSEEHTSELQSLMRISYAVFCLKKQKITSQTSVYHRKNTPLNTFNK